MDSNTPTGLGEGRRIHGLFLILQYPPTIPEASRRVRVHFVYHLPEVIVRRNALLVKSQTGKCQVGVGQGGEGGTPGVVSADPGYPRWVCWARVWLTSVDFPTFSRFRRQEYVNLATISNVLVKNMSISQQ